MNNDLSEEQYNALVRDAMCWRKHCILADKAEPAIMDHRGHSYWEGYSDGKRDAESVQIGITAPANYDWIKEYQKANAAPQAGKTRTAPTIAEEHPEKPAVAAHTICTVCGGRAAACRVLGHRPPGDETKWY